MGLRDRLRRRRRLGPYTGEDPIERILADWDFPTRYYELYERYMYDGREGRVNKPEVAKVVEALGESFEYAKVDRSWRRVTEGDGDPLTFTFVLQHGAVVEMLLSHRRSGSNFAIMANRIVQLSGGTVRTDGPYPRPIVRSPSELYDVQRFGCDVVDEVERGLRA